MEVNWFSNQFNYKHYILAVDIGGTNTRLALMGCTTGEGKLLGKVKLKSKEIDGLQQPLIRFLEVIRNKNNLILPELISISVAGLVANNYCQPTNCAWNIDANAIQKKIKIKTHIINDFSAICYGIPFLDTNNPDQISVIPHPGQEMLQEQGNVKAVVGAGTGLGVGFMINYCNELIISPSEGGHQCFAAFNQETEELKEYLCEKYGTAPGNEAFVSGPGISNIFNFLKYKKKIKIQGVLKQIDSIPDKDKPPYISRNAAKSPVCDHILKLFVSMYGSVAANVALTFLPFAGLYLGGGIAAKDERHFLEDHTFMRAFERSYIKNIEHILKNIPVYIIKDTNVSLYGAANAVFSQLL